MTDKPILFIGMYISKSNSLMYKNFIAQKTYDYCDKQVQ